jgi:hypothetical protein
MTRTLVVLCTLAAGLTGCATHREPPTPELVNQLNEQDTAQKKAQLAQPVLAAKYSDCNRAAAKAVAFQQDDPASLAATARDLCARFELELEKAVKNAYGDIIDPSDVNRVIEDARQAMLERNLAEIEAYRAASADAVPHCTAQCILSRDHRFQLRLAVGLNRLPGTAPVTG